MGTTCLGTNLGTPARTDDLSPDAPPLAAAIPPDVILDPQVGYTTDRQLEKDEGTPEGTTCLVQPARHLLDHLGS